MGTYIKIYNNAKQKYMYQCLLFTFSFVLFFSFLSFVISGKGWGGKGPEKRDMEP
jgi:hypothetical protein